MSTEIEGHLIYDFRCSNRAAVPLLKYARDALTSRRLFYWVPKVGEPVKIVHKIETHVVDQLPGRVVTYGSWRELEQCLKSVLAGVKSVAMEISRHAELPYVSCVDVGTVELVEACGVQVVSSQDLLLKPLSRDQLESHRRAAQVVSHTCDRAMAYIRDHLEGGSQITEEDVVEFILCEFAAAGCETDHRPICAVNEGSANPHYCDGKVVIKKGDFILIDLFCREEESGIFADITKVAVAAPEATPEQIKIFNVVKEAREAAIARVQQGNARGFEVDRAARDVIEKAGYGDYFIHRTGHDIGLDLHGPGTHMDDFETHDTRPVISGSVFSIEPGIYLPGKFGVRLECDVVVIDDEVEVTGEPQDKIATLL